MASEQCGLWRWRIGDGELRRLLLGREGGGLGERETERERERLTVIILVTAPSFLVPMKGHPRLLISLSPPLPAPARLPWRGGLVLATDIPRYPASQPNLSINSPALSRFRFCTGQSSPTRRRVEEGGAQRGEGLFPALHKSILNGH